MKDFRLAHIVSNNMLDATKDEAYFMCLAHIVKDNDSYTEFFKKRKEEGKYVLMDNGAAENSQLGYEDLYQCYLKLKPTEMVLCDTLLDCDDTIRKTKESLDYFKSKGVDCKFMAVPQGKTKEEWLRCCSELIKLPIDTIGISKFLNVHTGKENIRVELLDEIRNTIGDKEIHLLGNDVGPSELRRAREKNVPNLRGCDTCLAHIFTKAGIEMNNFSKRKKDMFIDFENDTLNGVELLRNIQAFNKSSGVEDNNKLWED